MNVEDQNMAEQKRLKKNAYLRELRAKWKQDPEWVSKNNDYIRSYWHRSAKFKDDKEKRRERERLKWKTNPEFRAKKTAYRKILGRRLDQKLKHNAYRKRQRDENPWAKFVNSARSRIWASLKGKGRKKWASVAELVGCTKEEMMAHIESQFTVGMSWSNHGCGPGMWHIDHVRPLASFDLSTVESQREAFSYKNTKPVWSEENISKASVYNGRRWRYADSVPAQI